MGNSNTRKPCNNEDDKSPSLKSSSISRRTMRQRFYNAHHTWNEIRDGSGKDLMFEFIYAIVIVINQKKIINKY